ncbi:MAG: hypothetical protein V4721_13290 [Bacteroidota bacterium]
MKRLYIILAALLFLSGCKKENVTAYVVEVTGDLSLSGGIGLERYNGNAKLIIVSSPQASTVVVPTGSPIHVTAGYFDPAITNSISVTIKDRAGKILAENTGAGSVDIVYGP